MVSRKSPIPTASHDVPGGPPSTETPFRRWTDRLSAQAGQRVFEVGIPMRDGLELAADVYLPTDTTLGAVPAVVELTPYSKDGLRADDAELWRTNGYVFVAVDVRGRGKSEGEWIPIVNDPTDTHDVIEWAASQPWCNRNVGTTGLSYMGWVQWAGASERPAHLKAMISTSAAGRWQQEIPFTNGVFQLYCAGWSYATRRRIQDYGMAQIDWEAVLRTLPVGAIGDVINGRGDNWELLSTRDTLDDFWRSLRYDNRYHEIDVPCLHVTGWYDQEDLLGAFHHYEGMRAASPARDSQFLLVGPWSHLKSRYPDSECGGIEFGPEAAIDMDAEHLRWFDYWLKGRDTGVRELDPVRIFEPGRNRWRGAPSWPLSDGERSLYLAPGQLMDQLPVEESTTTYRYDPDNPASTTMDIRTYPLEDVMLEQTVTEGRHDVLCYTSAPLTTALTVSGWPTLELAGSSDGDDTDWHVKLTDVGPDARSFRVTQGCLRAACRESLEKPEPLVPGQIYRFSVELWPTHHVFVPGHSVRVTITSSDFPWFARSMNRFGHIAELAEPRVAVNTVHHGGAHASRLRLPVRLEG